MRQSMACLMGHSYENNKYSAEYIVKYFRRCNSQTTYTRNKESDSTMAVLEEKFNVQKKIKTRISCYL